MINAKAGYSFLLKKKWGLSAMFLINNVTDTRYASMVVVNAPGTESRPPRYYYPGMPRWVTFTVGLKYRLRGIDPGVFEVWMRVSQTILASYCRLNVYYFEL